MTSYATTRKLKIIEDKLGSDWRASHPGMSIDRIYNTVTGDERKNLFCKINPRVKAKIDEMVREYDVDMAELIERMIEDKYETFVIGKSAYVTKLASQFAD